MASTSAHREGLRGASRQVSTASSRTTKNNNNSKSMAESLETRALKLGDLNAQFLHHRTRLVEKLLDIQVNDELSAGFKELRRKERETNFGRSFSVPFSLSGNDGEPARRYVTGRSSSRFPSMAGGANASELERTVRERLRDECRVDAALAVERWFTSPRDEAFLFVMLHRLATMPRSEAQQEVRSAVAQYVDPHVRAFWAQKQQQRAAAGYGGDGDLKSVEAAVRRAVEQQQEELEKNRTARAELRRAGRVHRVQAALALLRKDIGDVSSLRYVVPERYEERRPELHAREELRRLRVRVQKQHLEEQALQRQLETARAEADRRLQLLQDKLDALRDAKRRLQHDIAAKEVDMEELQAAAGVDGGRSVSWAEKTVELELKLAEAMREEPQLQATCGELRRQLQSLTAEKNALDAELASEEAALAAALTEEEDIAGMLATGLERARTTVLQLRRQQSRVVRDLNAMRDTMVVGRGRGVSSRMSLKARMLACVAQLELENLLQARLKAEVEWEQEQLRTAQEAARQSRQQQTKQEQQTDSFEKVLALAKELARYAPATTSSGSDSKKLESLGVREEGSIEYIQDCIVERHDTCLQLRGEIAQMLTSKEDALLTAQRQLDRVEYQLFEWRLREEVLLTAPIQSFRGVPPSVDGLPVPLPSAAALHHDAQLLYAAVSHALHREGRCKAILQLLQDYADHRSRGDAVKLLPFRPLAAAAATTRREGSSARRAPSLPYSVAGCSTASVGTSQTQLPLSSAAAHRKMVLQFIKNEIQPLYDTNQISRVRFMDVVERVSRWFLSTHTEPQLVLTDVDRQALCQQIQATLTWQDERRIKKHSAA